VISNLHKILFSLLFITQVFSMDLIDEQKESFLIKSVDIHDIEQDIVSEHLLISSVGGDMHSIEILDWLKNEVIPIKPHNTLKKLIMNGTECYISLARGAVYLVLGYNLAHSLFNLKEGETGDEILSVFYGELAAIPMLLLGSVSSRQFIDDTNTFFERCFTNKRNYEKVIEKPFMERAIKFGSKLLFIGTPALISSATITNLAKEELSPIIGNSWWIFGAPNLFVRALMDYEKIPIVFEKVRNTKIIGQFVDKAKSYMNLSNERKLLEDETKQFLLECKAHVNALDNEKIFNLLAIIKDKKDSSNEEKISALFNGRRKIKKEELGEKITGGTLAAVSVGGLWVYYTLTADAFKGLLGSEGLDIDTGSFGIDNSSYLLSSLALSSASAIIAVGGYETGKNLWGLLKSAGSSFFSLKEKIKSCCYPSTIEARRQPVIQEETNLQPYVMGTLSTVLAGFTASTAYSIYDDWPIANEVAAMCVLTAAITSQFTLSAWAVNGALKKYSMSKNPREPLLTKIDMIIRKLPDISNNHLKELREIILKNNFNVTN